MSKHRNWVLLRGLIRGSFHWHDFPERLQKAFPDDTIHLLDIPGNGRRNKESSPFTIQDFAEDLRFLTRRLSNIHVVTISLGGMIVMDWLARHPEEVEHAFIMNTSLGDTGPFYKRLNYWNYPVILKSFLKDEETIEKLILDLTCNNMKVFDEVLPHHIEMAKKYPLNRLNFVRQIVAAGASRFNPHLAQFKNLHLLVSQNDRLVHCDNTFVLANKLGISATVHPWAGHDMTIDDPDFVVTHCLNKLTSP